MHNIQTLDQFRSLQNDTMIYAIMVAGGILVVSSLIVTIIPYQGGNDRSYIFRRMSLTIMTIVSAFIFWLCNSLYVMDFIKNPAYQAQFSHTNLVCFIGIIIGVLLISIVVMYCFPQSKFGSMRWKKK